MNTDSETEYHKYIDSKNQTELEKIATTIDRGRYPMRYEMILSRIQMLKKSPELRFSIEKEQITPREATSSNNSLGRLILWASIYLAALLLGGGLLSGLYLFFGR